MNVPVTEDSPSQSGADNLHLQWNASTEKQSHPHLCQRPEAQPPAKYLKVARGRVLLGSLGSVVTPSDWGVRGDPASFQSTNILSVRVRILASQLLELRLEKTNDLPKVTVKLVTGRQDGTDLSEPLN